MLLKWENIVNEVAKREVGVFVVKQLGGGMMKLKKKSYQKIIKSYMSLKKMKMTKFLSN